MWVITKDGFVLHAHFLTTHLDSQSLGKKCLCVSQFDRVQNPVDIHLISLLWANLFLFHLIWE